MVKAYNYRNCGLGVAFIRHRSRLRMEKYSLAVYEEKELFRTRPYLSLIDKFNKSIVKLDRLAPPTARLAAFLRVLSPLIQNTLSHFLEFKHDDSSIAHPKGLLKLLNQSRGEFFADFLFSEILVVIAFLKSHQAFTYAIEEHISDISEIILHYFEEWCDKAEAHIKSQFLFAFDNQYDDHLTAISKATSYAVKLLKKKLKKSLVKFLKGDKVANYKRDPQVKESINHLMVRGLNEFKRYRIIGSLRHDGEVPVPPGYNKSIEEEELERELALYVATRSIASRATKWLPDDH
uniref:Uncharacterized protein n=1 Tax=Tanacetum cinerariifolium TaxID=118510 RepID=A0A699HS59_TANCI|nr:hypothetical protein [Tanacetum cinerariifolium]